MSMAISEGVVDAFLEILPQGKTLLEIGTGEGTKLLAEYWKVISVENNPAWHVGVSKLLHARLRSVQKSIPESAAEFWTRFPEATRWYDSDVLKKRLQGVSYDAILIDGPPGGPRRLGMWYFYPLLFDISVPVIVDDVHRKLDWMIAVRVAQIKGVPDFRVVQDGDKMFAVIQ